MRTWLSPYSRALLLINLLLVGVAQAQQQIDIHGPAGSVYFGAHIAVLANGNIVVTDPSWSPTPGGRYGAAYLYGPNGTLINTLTGSSPNDRIGENGVVVLVNGNYIILSPDWSNGAASSAGAATFAKPDTGVGNGATAQVDPNSNSLVGTHSSDFVGGNAVALANGNYVVTSASWNTDSTAHVGAITWGNGASGTFGTVSAGNSLTGSTAGDVIGVYGVVALPNSSYVVLSGAWSGYRGAVTWLQGASATSDVVSATNSLVGTTPGSPGGDFVGAGGVAVLSNGNYVVPSPSWNGGIGAATWVNGSSGTPKGTISASNSLIGDVAGDYVGSGIVALKGNGNYVVTNTYWNNKKGAATWGNGNSGAKGKVGTNPSITGNAAQDQVGRVTALSSGNYVVSSEYWNANRGSVTFGNGATGTNAAVSASNSLLGTAAGDYIGRNVLALKNGNYVVGSPLWNGGRGAATWCGPITCVAPSVGAANSLVGNAAGDAVGNGLTALSNGNYVVASPAANSKKGAVTWGKGSGGTVGTLAANPSIVGATANDQIGNTGVLALTNGNYVVFSNVFASGFGAATWANGNSATGLTVSSANSLVGTDVNDNVGSLDYSAVGAFADGDYAFLSGFWSEGGAMTFGHGYQPITGHVSANNSVLGGGVTGTGRYMYFAYDAVRKHLVVSRDQESIVSIFNGDYVFKDGFGG